MTGNIALDVVIGLVFIYLLYSLFATVIMEMVNSVFGLRAKNLRYAISRMLMDEKEDLLLVVKPEDSYHIRVLKNSINLIQKIVYRCLDTFTKVFGRSSSLSNPQLFHEFRNQPTIKYLSSGGISRNPSYISSQNFSKAIVDTLKSNFKIEDVLKKLNLDFDILEKSFEQLDDSSELKQEFYKLHTNLKEFENWFQEKDYLEKLKLLEQLLPLNLNVKKHVQFILNTVGVISGKSNRSDQLHHKRNILVEIKEGIAQLPKDSHTRIHIESLLTDANNDLQKFKSLLEQWFDDTMERSAGWFKRRTQYFLFIIGFGLAVNFNINTLDIIKKLSNNTEAREQLVNLAIAYTKANKNYDSISKVEKIIQADIDKVESTIATNWKIPNNIVNSDSITAKDIPQGYIFHNYSLIVCDTVKGKECELEDGQEKIDVTSLVHESIDLKLFEESLLPTYRADYDKKRINVNERKYKWSYVFARNGFQFKYLWGYILTALAISLGSPFWFDLLNRLVKLRSSIKPNQQKTNTKASNKGNDSSIHRVG